MPTKKQRRAESDFAIRVDYVPGVPDPARVYRTMIQLIDTFQKFDRELVHTIDINIEPVMVLEDIQTGSLKTWVRSLLSSVDDTALGEGDWKKVVGKYLVRAKRALLKRLEDHADLGGRDGVQLLQQEIRTAAEENRGQAHPCL